MQQPRPIFDTLARLLLESPSLEDLEASYAEYDLNLVTGFLKSYRGSEATFNAYRRDIERLLHWSWLVAKKSVLELTREDIESFIEFCQHPPATWVGTSHAPRFINRDGMRISNVQWKPFVKDPTHTKAHMLSEKALQALFAIVGSFYNYLLQENKIHHNPVAQIRQKSKFFHREMPGQPIIRRLSELQWHYLVETAQLMAQEQPESHERTLFMVSALFAMYLRISELCASKRHTPTMGDFRMDMDGNWWFHTIGKGNKARIISVSDAMLDALKRYRKFLGYAALPTPGETTPLIAHHTSGVPITSTRHIRTVIQQCFDQTVSRLCADGFNDEADQLSAATVHWLRHTGISEDVKHRPREHVRDDAGHSSSAITDKYIDIELRARHASAKKKQMC